MASTRAGIPVAGKTKSRAVTAQTAMSRVISATSVRRLSSIRGHLKRDVDRGRAGVNVWPRLPSGGVTKR